MNIEELAERLLSIAESQMAARAELDAMRLVMTALIPAINADSAMAKRFAGAIKAVIEVDAGLILATPLPDSLLLARTQWLERLLPPGLLSIS
jgi:hypothetical protein